MAGLSYVHEEKEKSLYFLSYNPLFTLNML